MPLVDLAITQLDGLINVVNTEIGYWDADSDQAEFFEGILDRLQNAAHNDPEGRGEVLPDISGTDEDW